jgi:hypothetical protein
MCRFLKFVGLLVLCAAFAQAGDVAVLRNGNSIRHERRQVLGPNTRLYLGDAASGYIEIPTSEIDHFETDADPPPTGAANSDPSKVQPAAARAAASDAANRTLNDPQALNMIVSGAGQRHQVDPDFINSVIRAESGFNNRAVSRKGAEGLMQLMPQTASHLGVTNVFDPKANVEGGTKYLRELLEKYHYDVPKALAAYNAGPRRVDQYRGVPPYQETQAYVARIIRDFNRKKLAEDPQLAQKKKSPSTRSSARRITARKANGVQSAVNSVAQVAEPHSR